MARILVIDDEPGICRAFEKFLGEAGHEVRVSSRAETGLTLAQAFKPDLVILDVRLPGMDGLAALKRLKDADSTLPVIVITAYGTMETAVAAVQRGAYDYILKPLDLARTSEIIGQALEGRRQAREVAISGAGGAGPAGEAAFATLLGRTPVMQEVFKKIGAVSLTDVSVLLVGESGTGKETAARAVHYSSPRAECPFEQVNCGAIPEAHLDGELYGGVKPGRIERADGGTLFLDEVADLPASAQVKLVRFLERGKFEGEEGGAVDIRVVAATNRDLRDESREGRFREDLFYRLGVMTIRLPPLRDRVADIPLLTSHLLAGRDESRGAISREALRTLMTYSWPGNVRELRNAVDHALVLARRGTILPEHLPEHVLEGADRRPTEDAASIRQLVERLLDGEVPEGELYATVMARFEVPLIAKVLERTHGNQVKAAKILGIHRTTLRTKIQKYGL